MKNLFSLVFILISGLSIAQVPSYVPTNGLVGWWPFNGNANDESGNGLNGEIINAQNGLSFSSDRFNNPLNSLRYNSNINQQANAPYVNVLNSGASIAVMYSINLWAKFDPSLTTGELINKGSDNNSFFSRFQSSTSIAFGNLPIYLSTGINIDPVSWHMYTFTYNSSGIGKLYIDGNLVYNQQVSSPSSNSNNLSFGKMPSGGTNGSYYPYQGFLDDIGIWNRALTEAEILALYEGCQLSITSQPQDQNVTTSVGVANFNVASTATNPTYQWQTNLGLGFQNISNAGQYSGATSSSLSVSNFSISNNNQVFRCILNDGSCVDTTAEATLIIIDDAGIQTNNLTSLKLYPNPVQDVLKIEGLTCKEFEYEVLSIDGKLLQKGTSQGEIAVKELRKGNYVLRVGQQKVSFVKQ